MIEGGTDFCVSQAANLLPSGFFYVAIKDVYQKPPKGSCLPRAQLLPSGSHHHLLPLSDLKDDRTWTALIDLLVCAVLVLRYTFINWGNRLRIRGRLREEWK